MLRSFLKGPWSLRAQLLGLTFAVALPLTAALAAVKMPDMDGIELIRHLRECLPRLPVLAVCGGGAVEAATLLRMAGALGASGYLAKPFEVPDLLDTVRRVLAGGRG